MNISSDPGAAGVRVLIIDDDPLSLKIISLQLGAFGYDAATAAGGEEALQALTAMTPQVRPEILLVDLHIPGLSGRELTQQLRKLVGSDARIIAMSASTPGSEDIDCFDGFVLKPLDPQLFQKFLRERRTEKDGPEHSGPVQASLRKTAGSAISSEGVLDPGVLSKLRGMMSPAAVSEVLDAFIEDTHARVGRMRAAASAGDIAQLRAEAHAVKGSAGMVGAQKLAGICDVIEGEGYQGLGTVQLLDTMAEELLQLQYRVVATRSNI